MHFSGFDIFNPVEDHSRYSKALRNIPRSLSAVDSLPRDLNPQLHINKSPQRCCQPQLVIIPAARVDNTDDFHIVSNSLLKQGHVEEDVVGAALLLAFHEEYDSGVGELLLLDEFDGCYDGEDGVAVIGTASAV